jgi:protein-tyrosine-phosphatase
VTSSADTVDHQAPHSARPIDPDRAQALATRIAAAADPVSVLILRRLVEASGRPVLVESVIGDVGAPPTDARERIERMIGAGLILRSPGDRLRADPEALLTFAAVLGIETASATRTGFVPDALSRTADLLVTRFASTFAEETVRRYVQESFDLLSERATVTVHLPTLAGRFAADRLAALATANGLVIRSTPEVLFVCTRNASRSQMAAATLRHIGGNRVHVRTAGTAPATRIDPNVERVLAEVGIALPIEFPKPLTDEAVRASDYVITMGCGDACPVHPGRRYLDWAVEDPAGAPLARVRGIRDQIIERVESLGAELGVA